MSSSGENPVVLQIRAPTLASACVRYTVELTANS